MLRPLAAFAVVGCLSACPAFAQPKPPADPFGPLPPADLARPVAVDSVKPAVEAFQAGKYAAARDLFAQAAKEKALTTEQHAAWAYSRVKVATDRLNASTDAATAAEVVAEIEDALAAVPTQTGLQSASKDILAAARKRAGPAKIARGQEPPPPLPGPDALDSGSFVVKFSGRKATADELLKAAEVARTDIFTRWSGPPGGNWSPKCEIVLHATADTFAAATGLPATATGRGEVKLGGKGVASRRIDLRADDETLLEVALPRELAHVVFADLYPNQPPPPWAAVAVGVLSTNDAEIGRYLRTAGRCAKSGELLTAAALLDATEVPAKNVTGFHAASVMTADYLVRWKGEKAFHAFVRDGLRYGPEVALKRQYGLADARALDDAVRKGW